MKSDKYQKRFYRDWPGASDLHKAEIIVQETDLYILTDKPIDRDFAAERARFYRRQIEAYIQKDRRFLTALKPIEVELNAAPIVKGMSRAAKKANVGPMAAVAGAIAEFLGRDLLKKGFKEVIIENGGDIFLKILKTRRVAIYAGKTKLSNKLYLKIKPQDSPLGICASSATVGHSLSFGRADSVVILSRNALLADAAATAVCNKTFSKEPLRKAVEFARSIKGVVGTVIVCGNSVLGWGKIEFG
ncbi:MAG: UPF0280 family protein [Candidatus Omnitrophica bacterium]|nr:UPF0280 family protein [Candidatus Omnitrophota bacterium]